MKEYNYVGEIRQYAGPQPPEGWIFCHGQLLSIEKYGNLFRLIGNTFGGNGTTHFALPDLRGRAVLGRSDRYPLGAKGGHESVTLTEAQLPAHHHRANVSGNTTPNNNGPANGFWGSNGEHSLYGTPADTAMNPGGTATAGNGQPHENRIPFFVMSYIIATDGIFPLKP